MGWFRDAAYLAAVTVSAPVWAVRMARSGKHRTDWRARFGHGAPLDAPAAPRLLLHAVSVGEVNALRGLVSRMSFDPVGPELVVAATTDTGFRRATEAFGSRHPVVRYPFDASWMVERFLDRVRPDAVALCELEVWPNFVDACTRRGIPVTVINGRLSERSFRRYALARRAVAPTFAKLHAVLAQDQEYAARFRALGVPGGKVFVGGTMKWDSAEIADRVSGADELAAELGIDRARPLVVAGSTAPEEHALLRDAVPPGTQLLCAPRRPEWFDGAAADLAGCARRSAGSRGSATGRFLLDTIGELRKAYSLADVVVVGRSFGQLHGSDPMEPAALGKPVVCGPRMGDFRESARALVAGGGMRQVDARELGAVLAALIADADLRGRAGAASRATVRANQGATERTAEALLSILASSRGAHA